ncbi:MAG: hypothetical protein WDN46_02065 [Methylocella sp.]
MGLRAFGIFKAPRFAAALAVAGIGVIVGIAGDFGGSSGFGVVRSSFDQAAGVPAPGDLAGRLEEVRRLARIDPNQDSAWRDFASSMLRLERLTQDYERRLAAGERLDEAAERARHALLFGSAMNQMDQSLSPEQSAAVHRLTDELASKVICKSLSGA